MTAEHEASSPLNELPQEPVPVDAIDPDAVDGVLSAIEQNSELLSRLIVRLRDEGHLEMSSAPQHSPVAQSESLIEPDSETSECQVGDYSIAESEDLSFESIDDPTLSSDIGGVDQVSSETLAIIGDNNRLREENESLRKQLQGLYEDFGELKQKNSTLSSQLSDANRVKAVPKSDSPINAPGALTWQERKQQIIEQLENDSFDAEEFLCNLQGRQAKQNPESASKSSARGLTTADDAIKYLDQLHDEIEQLRDAEQQYEQQSLRYLAEIEALKSVSMTFRETPSASEGGAFEASASDDRDNVDLFGPKDLTAKDETIEAILSGDQIIMQERERLTLLQEEVEEKLREIEIRSSLERAQLARRTVELEKVNDNLRRQLDDLKQRLTLDFENGVTTRWMQKLGLSAKRKGEKS
ncbi:hypothetical protein LOC67_07845 [Stieleria sp. JC731]|uniref:hypothetical protein n=1 Tax=Pirellulaceae TaxID=2691357 RepID=UPI001E3B6766|nr:hypothetical protein [Stieleria sp. JC731]MCC9600470.1 hypothetical protein [Stieleria sp. JC731]